MTDRAEKPGSGISRRQFLRGDFSSADTRLVRIGRGCLAHQKIVCRSCGDACEPRAIRFRLEPGGVGTPVVDETQCNRCGACAAACPASAITLAPA